MGLTLVYSRAGLAHLARSPDRQKRPGTTQQRLAGGGLPSALLQAGLGGLAAFAAAQPARAAKQSRLPGGGRRAARGRVVARSGRGRRRPSSLREAAYEWLMDPKRRVTNALLGAILAAFVGQVVSRGALTAWGVQHRRLVLGKGQWYRLLSAGFLHQGLMHLGVNAYSLNNVGPPVEALLGRGRFLALYLLSGVGCSALSMTLGRGPALGASGAVFGVLGSLGVQLFTLTGRGSSASMSIVSTIALNLLLGASLPRVDNWGHVGGLASGVVLTALLGPLLWRVRARDKGGEAVTGARDVSLLARLSGKRPREMLVLKPRDML